MKRGPVIRLALAGAAVAAILVVLAAGRGPSGTKGDSPPDPAGAPPATGTVPADRPADPDSTGTAVTAPDTSPDPPDSAARAEPTAEQAQQDRWRRLAEVLGMEGADPLALLNRAHDSPDGAVRALALAVELRGMVDPADAIEEALLEMEECTSIAEQLAAARFLAELKEPDLDGRIAPGAAGEDVEESWAFCVALHTRGSPSSISDWAVRAAGTQSPDVLRAALARAAAHPVREVEPVAEAGARHDDPALRAAAAAYFAKADGPAARDWLQRLAGDPDPSVRAAAAAR
ncbi:MAG: hypothetical protein MUE73_03420 [Planctomycetes bacterium]|nr:hypothetical protein [Planctomycetota bacterium]